MRNRCAIQIDVLRVRDRSEVCHVDEEGNRRGWVPYEYSTNRERRMGFGRILQGRPNPTAGAESYSGLPES